MNPWRRDHRPLAIAHRGHSLECPENTVVAYTTAIDLGAEMIEADVNITLDGELVMIHDTTLDRTTSGAGPVSARTLREVERLDAGGWFHRRFGGARVPSAAATLALAREAGISLCLEVKGGDPPEARRIAERLADLIVEHDALGTTVMSGYDHDALAAARRRVPELMLAPERLPDNVPADPADACRQARRLGAGVVQNHHAFLDRDLVEALHADEIAVWAWPTTDRASLVASTAAGADGLMGDDIRTMVRVLLELRPTPIAKLPAHAYDA